MLDIAQDEWYVPVGMVIHEMLMQFLRLSTKLCIFLDSSLSLTWEMLHRPMLQLWGFKKRRARVWTLISSME